MYNFKNDPKDENIVIEQEETHIIIMWNDEEKKIDSVDYESGEDWIFSAIVNLI